jgi:threonyl-tRNA synthetase
MLVIGEKEMQERKVSLRKQGKGDAGVQDLDTFAQELAQEILERRPLS